MRYYLAVDIGASSGRHIVGWKENGEIRTREVYRFPNGVTELDGHLTWDIEALENHVRAGIDAALEEYPQIESLSVDTWGVDYVLMDGNRPVLPCYAYRDSRTEAVIPQAHERIPFPELYRRTGIQFQPFNTVYQLYADKLAGRLDRACGFLMIPEYLMYRLCGVKSHEYTNATTGGMVNAETGEYDPEIIKALDLPEQLFIFRPHRTQTDQIIIRMGFRIEDRDTYPPDRTIAPFQIVAGGEDGIGRVDRDVRKVRQVMLVEIAGMRGFQQMHLFPEAYVAQKK